MLGTFEKNNSKPVSTSFAQTSADVTGSVRRVLCVSDVLCTRIEGNARKIFTLLYGDIGSMMRFATGDLYVR